MRLFWLNYGPSGSGKSYLPYTAIVPGWKVLHLDLGNEAGPLTYPAGSKLVNLLQDVGGDESKLYQHTESVARGILEQVHEKKFQYDLVVLDSLDALQAAARPLIIEEEALLPHRGTLDKELLSQRGYGRLYIKMRAILLLFQAAGVHFYTTATPGYKQDPTKPKLKDPKTDELLNVQIRPDLEGRLAGNIERFFDLVSFQSFDPDQSYNHRIFLRESASPKVKNRYDGELQRRGLKPMPAYMDNPTWETLVVPLVQVLQGEKL